MKYKQNLNAKRLAGPSEKPKVKIAKKERVIFNPTGKRVVDDLSPTKEFRVGKYAHFCYEWDEMLIDETDPEFEACNCGKPNPKT